MLIYTLSAVAVVVVVGLFGYWVTQQTPKGYDKHKHKHI